MNYCLIHHTLVALALLARCVKIYYMFVIKHIGKNKYFVLHIPLKRFNNLIFRGTCQHECELGLWCQKENTFSFVILAKEAGRVSGLNN